MLNALRLKLPNALRVTETRLETTYEQRKARDSRTHPYKPGGCMLFASFSNGQTRLKFGRRRALSTHYLHYLLTVIRMLPTEEETQLKPQENRVPLQS